MISRTVVSGTTTRPIPESKLECTIEHEIKHILYVAGIEYGGSTKLNDRINLLVERYYDYIISHDCLDLVLANSRNFAERIVEESNRDYQKTGTYLKQLSRYIDRSIKRCGIIFWCQPPAE